MKKVLILIPSRMSAKRLPGKPLLKINNLPLISHVVKRGEEAELGEVIVCAEDKEIANAVEENGGRVILTGSHHNNGTERIYEGLKKLQLRGIEHVISLQGDEPAINPEDIKNLYSFMTKYNCEIGTLASTIKDKATLKNENVVKVKTSEKLKNNNFVIAINFFRDYFLKNELNIYHHHGIYCYKTETLEKFVNLKQTENEIKNRLEQLRAVDNNIKINVALSKSSPIGIDTNEDYLALKKIMEYKS